MRSACSRLANTDTAIAEGLAELVRDDVFIIHDHGHLLAVEFEPDPRVLLGDLATDFHRDDLVEGRPAARLGDAEEPA